MPLEFALESMVKNQKLEGVDNEHEEEVIARGGEKKEREKGEEEKKGDGNENDVMIEMVCMESKEKGAENGGGVGLEGGVLEEEAGVNEELAVANGSAHFDEMMRRGGERTLQKGCGRLEVCGIVGRSLFYTRMNGF